MFDRVYTTCGIFLIDFMHNLYGIWVDHAHAHIVRSNLLGDNMTIIELTSGVEPHHHAGINDEEHHTIANQHAHDHRRSNQMHAFCEEIVKHIADADEIAVFGPGTAKHDFKHELEKHKVLHDKLVAVETTDKLSEAELKAFVKKVFMLPR